MKRRESTEKTPRPAIGMRSVATPAQTDDAANSHRPEIRSAKLSRADPIAPATKPSCTDIVSQAWLEALNPQAAVSAGTTAEAENQTDIPKSSVKERRACLLYTSDAADE